MGCTDTPCEGYGHMLARTLSYSNRFGMRTFVISNWDRMSGM